MRSNRTTEQLPIVSPLSRALHLTRTWWMLAGDKHYFYALSLRQGEWTLASTFPFGFHVLPSSFVHPGLICAVRRADVEVSFPTALFPKHLLQCPLSVSPSPRDRSQSLLSSNTSSSIQNMKRFLTSANLQPIFLSPSIFLARRGVNDSSFDCVSFRQ